MASSSADGKMLNLVSSDGEEFEVSEEVAMQSQALHHMIEDECADGKIPLPSITGKVLSKILEYCKAHAHSSTNDDLKAWDAKFVQIDNDFLLEVILGANYLDIKELMDLTCRTIADTIKDKTVEEIRTFFNIESDYTPEEEEKIREENKWAFD